MNWTWAWTENCLDEDDDEDEDDIYTGNIFADFEEKIKKNNG